MKNPLVTIITPCYNASSFIIQTVESVRSQSYNNWEMLLIDDKSTDSTLEIIQRLSSEDKRIKILTNDKNSGVAATRNRGLEVAQGQLICFLDSDDIWVPRKLEIQISAAFKNNSNFLFSDYDFINENNKYLRTFKTPNNISRNNLLKGSFIGTLTVMVSRNLLGESKFKPNSFHEDYLLWLELFSKPEVKPFAIKELLAKYRQRNTSLSASKFICAKEQWSIYRNQLGYSFLKSAYYFVNYAIKGILKHYV